MGYNKVVDLSHHNRELAGSDWPKFVDGAIIRGGYGMSSVDNYCKSYIEDCVRCGKPWGMYFYSYATNVKSILPEFEFYKSIVVDMINRYGVPKLGVWLDLEDGDAYKSTKGAPLDQIVPKQVAEWKRFWKFDERKFPVGIYCNTDWYQKYGITTNPWCDLWIAAWSTDTEKMFERYPAFIHQYTDKEYIYGYRVDMSHVDPDWWEIAMEGEGSDPEMNFPAGSVMSRAFDKEQVIGRHATVISPVNFDGCHVTNDTLGMDFTVKGVDGTRVLLESADGRIQQEWHCSAVVVDL